MVLFFLFSILSFSQNSIIGTVKDSVSNKYLQQVNILIKTKEGKLIDFAVTNEQGKFNKVLPKDYSEFKIETSIISHEKSIKVLEVDLELKSEYLLNFLLKERVNKLEEVYIEAKKPPITVKKDTTVYDIKKFKDGSEQVVEDILKKLPGITVLPNGLIKFKGKQVTRLLLDNDNIFDSNYSIGTKNISSDIIEAIEAFEDYSDNPLLKGVKSSQDVAINLKLKKGKTDISGDTELGLGFDAKKLAKVNVIAISKKIKGFSSLSYNNIGENFSPYNFQSNSIDISRLQELNQRSSNLVNGNGFNSTLPDNRTRVNDNFFGSINTLLKLSKKTTLRLNYNIFSDNLIRQEETNILNDFDGQQINISTSENFIKNPFINSFSYELRYDLADNQLLTSNGKLDYQKIDKNSEGLNNSLAFTNRTSSRDLFFNNNLEYTNKLNKSTVFQTQLQVSTNSLPQTVNVINNSNIDQDIDFMRNTIDLKSTYLRKYTTSELGLALGYNFNEDFVNTNLLGINVNQSFVSNDIYYNIENPYFEFNYKYNLSKWLFGTSIRADILSIKFNDVNLIENFNNSQFVLYPSFSAKRLFSQKSNVYFDFRLSNNLPKDRNLFSGLILTDNRSFRNNNFEFNLLNNQNFTLGYAINDFYNLFQFNLFADYNFSEFGYISQLNIDEDVTFSTSILDATDNENLSFGLRTEKYVNFLKSTINLNSNYTISKFQNIVNGSALRDNTSQTLFANFDIRTGFKGALNFRNKVSINNTNFSTDGGLSNSFTTFQNDFSIKYIKEKFRFIVESQYFKPDLNSDIRGDLFLDANISFTSKNKKIEYSIRANNLLDNKVFQNINTSDFSTSIFQHNLQNRFILLSTSFKF